MLLVFIKDIFNIYNSQAIAYVGGTLFLVFAAVTLVEIVRWFGDIGDDYFCLTGEEI